jgi:glycosyltransferase involved in cell wall biosynthesis
MAKPRQACVSDTETARPDDKDTDRITVLQLIGSLRIGGAERQLASLVGEFDRRKLRVIVATMESGGSLVEQFRAAGVDIRPLGFRMRHFVSGVRRLCRLLRDEKVDVLHGHMYHAAWYGRIAGLLAGVPVMIATDHGQELWKKPWNVAFERYMNRHTSLRIAVSEDVAEILRKREHVPEDKLAVIPNGVDVDRFKAGGNERQQVRAELGLSGDAVVVGTVARLVEPKALHIMIRAVAQVADVDPRVRLLVVGDGPLRADLERCASDLGITERVIFTGMRSDIPGLLAAMDIFALSSISEGLPVSLLEAMAAGKPIVATRVGGIPEAVTDRRECLLVEPGDAKALADGIMELIRKPDLAAELGRRAGERVLAEYSIQATARKLEEIYSSLLAEARAAKPAPGRS